jgi:hypothetical protein
MGADAYKDSVSEAQWQATLVEQAGYYGWVVLLSIPDSGLAALGHIIQRIKKGQAQGPLRGLLALLAAISGWPDLTLGHPHLHRTICVEVKTNTGTVRANQKAMLSLLPRCGIPSYVWRPKDGDEVERVLSGVDIPG